jgi:pimeloyl-ACP methyl ester carboxylesterase
VRTAPSVEAAVELLRPEFEEYRAGRLAELPTTPRGDADRQDLEALSRPDGYLRDAAALLRGWEWDPAAVACPVLVVHGALDEQASVRNAHWLAAVVPGARLRVLEGATHLEALDESWDELLTFLADAARQL